MFSNPETNSRQLEIKDFISQVSDTLPYHDLSKKCDDFIMSFPPEDALAIAAVLGATNPFYLPNIPDEHFERLRVTKEQFLNALMRTRMTLQRSDNMNILVACMPKTASTFTQAALKNAFTLGTANLFAAALNSSGLGSNLMEQEPDEVALILAGLRGNGYVAQHHMRMSPYVGEMLNRYNVRPIVLYRNILDILVSIDDMILRDRKKMGDNVMHFSNDSLPKNFHLLDRDERLTILAIMKVWWLIQFYVSWQKFAYLGFTKPLWVSYEKDFLGDKKMLVTRIIAHLGQQDKVNPNKVLEAFLDKSGADEKRINIGVAGRGADVPDKVKEIVKIAAGAFSDEIDMTPIIGDL